MSEVSTREVPDDLVDLGLPAGKHAVLDAARHEGTSDAVSADRRGDAFVR